MSNSHMTSKEQNIYRSYMHNQNRIHNYEKYNSISHFKSE